ncbi:MAG: GNAT family N-acetyltransferase [Treponema sp.]|nr:GNAT family N-acetyltransferase [Treponema sp.]MDY5917413.1 GNAT family N-acetyltransferase [Treponema sp.]
MTKEYFEKALNHEVNTNFEVYKINGKTIGVVEYAVWDAYQNPGFISCTVCVIGNIVVKKEYRNQGIGTHLFEYIKNKKCPEFDVQRIELDMEAKNINALSVHKKLGLIEDRIRFSMNV